MNTNPASTFAPASEFLVQISSAPNKSSWKWQHRRVNVAVLEVVPGVVPRMISLRARGVRAIVSYEGMLYDGRSTRCEAHRARVRAEELAARLNAEAKRACDRADACAVCAS